MMQVKRILRDAPVRDDQMLQRSLKHLEMALESSICLEHCASKVVPQRAGDIRFHLEQARLLLQRSRRVVRQS